MRGLRLGLEGRRGLPSTKNVPGSVAQNCKPPRGGSPHPILGRSGARCQRGPYGRAGQRIDLGVLYEPCLGRGQSQLSSHKEIYLRPGDGQPKTTALL